MTRRRRSLWRAREGATAVEFAIVAPLLCALMIGLIDLTLILWRYGALQQAAEATARCAAIGSTDCATVPTGCDSANPVVCYAKTVADRRGVPGITASQVTVNAALTLGGGSFTSVSIAYNGSIVARGVTIRATGIFPNP